MANTQIGEIEMKADMPFFIYTAEYASKQSLTFTALDWVSANKKALKSQEMMGGKLIELRIGY